MKELAFVALWCAGMNGAAEVRLADETRVDCLTDTHAWEVDLGENWAEAVGQSLHYSRMTGKKAGVALRGGTAAQLRRLHGVIYHFDLPIDVRYF